MGAAPSADAGAGHTPADPPADVFVCVLLCLRRDWAARATVPLVCRGWAALAAQEATWRALCGANRLRSARGASAPADVARAA